jgi:hypothetical protein
MFEDSLDTKDQTSEGRESAEEPGTASYGLGRWAHFPAGLVFGILFVVLSGHPWRWYVAIDGAYTVCVFGFAIGSVIKDLDDFFGSAEIQRCAARLLIPHIPVLAVLTYGTFLWFHLNTILPSWLTQEGRKGSLWEILGWLALAVAGVTQGIWMSRRIKRQLGRRTDQTGEG